jgi:hypothetical protein
MDGQILKGEKGREVSKNENGKNFEINDRPRMQLKFKFVREFITITKQTNSKRPIIFKTFLLHLNKRDTKCPFKSDLRLVL